MSGSEMHEDQGVAPSTRGRSAGPADLSRFASQPSAAVTNADEPWIVWSNEHRQFWAPNRCGYTGRIEKAGRYTREEAEAICRNANYRANSTINVGAPPEICMPAPEALDKLRQKLRMIVSHATCGDSCDTAESINDICVRITQTRNHVYQAGAASAMSAGTAETAQQAQGRSPASAVPKADAQGEQP